MLKNFLKLILLCCFIIIFFVFGAYFYINTFYLPKTIVPLIETAVKTHTAMTISIKNIVLSPTGTITITSPCIYKNSSQKPLVSTKKIHVLPAYKELLNSWWKNKKNFSFPLAIEIKAIQSQFAPITIKGNVKSAINLIINTKSPEQSEYNGIIGLKDFTISGIPGFDTIKNFGGIIQVTKNKISIDKLSGQANKTPVTLTGSFSNFKEPHIILEASLNPLKMFIDCSIAENILKITSAKANYNNSSFVIEGNLLKLDVSPEAKLTMHLNLDLPDLLSLPLEMQSTLLLLNPQGEITANINVTGPINKIGDLKGELNITAKNLSCLQYSFKNLKLKALLSQGTATLEESQFLLFDNAFQFKARCDLLKPQNPFSADIQLIDFSLESLSQALNLSPAIGGTLNTTISVNGHISNPNLLSLTSAISVTKLQYDTITFALPINSKGIFELKNMQDIKIKNLVVNDSLTTLTASGDIVNIYNPTLAISCLLESDLKNIKSYPQVTVPSPIEINGYIKANTKLNGKLSSFNTMDIPFNIKSDTIKINQIEIAPINIQGTFSEMKLALTSCSAQAYGGDFNAQGTLDLSKPNNPDFKLKTSLKTFNLETFAKNTRLIDSTYKGFLNTDIKISGKGNTPANIESKGNFSAALSNAMINNIPLESVETSSEFDYIKDNLNIKNFNFNYNTIKLILNGTIKTITKTPAINITANTRLNLTDLNQLPIDLGPQLKDLTPTGDIAFKCTVNGSMPELDWTQLTITSTIASDEVIIKNIITENLKIIGNMEKNLLKINASAASYEGMASLELEANLLNYPTDFTYNSKITIKDINAGKLISESKIIPQQHEGIISSTVDLIGEGLYSNTIKGTADISMRNAKLDGLNILHDLGDLIGADFLSDFTITEAKGTFTIENSEISTQNTEIIGPDAVIKPTGAVTFSQHLNDFFITLILTEEGSKKISQNALDNIFIYNAGQYSFQTQIKGSFTDPKFDILKQAGKNALQNQILKAISGKAKNEPTTTTQENASSSQSVSVQDTIKDSIEKKIFKAFEGLF